MLTPKILVSLESKTDHNYTYSLQLSGRGLAHPVIEKNSQNQLGGGDGNVLDAIHEGTGGNSKNSKLKNVLYVPKLSYSLLSASESDGARF